MSHSLFSLLFLFVSCVSVCGAPVLQYGTISWRERVGSRVGGSASYDLFYCSGYLISEVTPAPLLGQIYSNGTLASITIDGLNINTPYNCTVTQIYQQGTFICCGSTRTDLLPRGVKHDVTLGVPSGGVRTGIPANSVSTVSPRFADVPLLRGILYYDRNITIVPTPVAQLPLEPYQATIAAALTCKGIASAGSVFSVSSSGRISLITTTVQEDLSPDKFVCSDGDTNTGAFTEILLPNQVTANPTLLNTVPVLLNSTQQLAAALLAEKQTQFLQDKTCTFDVAAIDADGDPVQLLKSQEPWPASATITPFFAPYILPNRIINNCTGLTVDNTTICTNTTLPPEFTDVGYPRVTTPSMFRITYTPSPADAAFNKTWQLCYRALDQRAAVSYNVSCLALYVPGPCPTINSTVFNSESVVANNPPLVGSAANWTCNPNYGIYTANGRYIRRESGASYSTSCLTTGWDNSIDVQCKALCAPLSVLHGAISATPSTLSIAGDVVTYSCDAGFRVTTQQRSYLCRDNGSFNTTEIPKCLPIPCSSLSIPNGVSQLNNGLDQITANITCSLGYLPSSPAQAVCDSVAVQWRNIPSCDPAPCQRLTLPPFVSIATNNNRTLGVTTVKCPDNWITAGATTTTCRETGAWDALDTKCAPVCRVADRTPVRGSVVESGVSAYVTPNTSVSFQCDQNGEQFVGATRYTCTSTVDHNTLLGSWSAQIGICSPVCLRSLLQSIGTTKYYVGINEPNILLSLNASIGQEFTKDKAPTGAQVYTSCLTGGSTGIVAYTCQSSGQWNVPASPCSVTCPIPVIPNVDTGSLLASYPNASDPNQRYILVDQSISLTCAPGYNITAGTSRLTCTNTGIAETPITCAKRSCPAVSLGPNVIPASVPATVPGSESIPLSCDDGYELQGTNSITCTSVFEWTNYADTVCFPSSLSSSGVSVITSGPSDNPEKIAGLPREGFWGLMAVVIVAVVLLLVALIITLYRRYNKSKDVVATVTKENNYTSPENGNGNGNGNGATEMGDLGGHGTVSVVTQG